MMKSILDPILNMMKLNKIITYVGGLFLVPLVNAVVVVEQSNAPNPIQDTKDIFSAIPWSLIFTITLITIFVCLIAGVIIWIALKIYKKINEDRRKKDNLEYFKYTNDIKMCHINSDKKYIYRVWYKLWLGKKRAKVYALSSNGKKYVGDYLGEATKKEGFYILGLYQIYSFFNRETDIVIFPFQLSKQLIRKNDDFTIDLMCEGVDEVMSSEYFSIPVFMNNVSRTKNDKLFTDFSNLVMEKYFREYAYRKVIKENIEEFKEGMKEATEMNPHIQLERKSVSSLNQRREG